MRSLSALLLFQALQLSPALAAGAEDPPPVPTPPPPGVVAPAPDPVGRSGARTPTDADAGGRPITTTDRAVGGSRAAVLQGTLPFDLPPDPRPEPRAEGAQAARGPIRVAASGFAYGYLEYLHYDVTNARNYDLTFGLGELEGDLDVSYGERAGARLDLNIINDPPGLAVKFPPTTAAPSLADRLVEQAYAWAHPGRFVLRAGRMDVPMGMEAVDPNARFAVGRSHLARLGRPTLMTGASADYEATPGLDAFAFVVNGWETITDNNRSKTLGGGLVHRAGLLEGRLSFIAGRERDTESNWRFVIDYGAALASGPFTFSGELLYGGEQGHARDAGGPNPNGTAKWWGGLAAAVWKLGSVSPWLGDIRVGARVEYLYDRDLVLGLPAEPTLPPLTELVGITPTLRVRIAPGLEVAAEYRLDLERADREGVAVHRNVDVVPWVWNVFQWYKTQRLDVAFIAEL
jgi:hypothetical protein